MYVYIRSEPGLWTVGFYDPDGQWHAESDHEDSVKAANRVAWLNGADTGLAAKVGRLEQEVRRLHRRTPND